MIRQEQKLCRALVPRSAHVGPAFAEGILCTLGQREYAVGRSLPRGVPALYVAFCDDLHSLQNFAQIGTVRHDISRIPQRLKMECLVGEETASWADCLRGACYR